MLQAQLTKIVSRLLTVVMCYHILGYAVLFRATDWLHRSVMEELLNENEFARLKIPKSKNKNHPEIFIRINDDEIFFEGNYYDVKNESSDNEFYYFEALNDSGEKDWHQQLGEAQTNSNHSDAKKVKLGTNGLVMATFLFFVNRVTVRSGVLQVLVPPSATF